ncbi:MAG: YgcG family protein [Nitrosomonas sp.]|nr:MAG: YgcG family protein [Nitrosomonas sp.]
MKPASLITRKTVQRLHCCYFILLCLALAVSHVQAEVAVPPLKRHVTDLTATLSAQEVASLEQRLAAFESTGGSQIAVLMIPTTQPEAIEQYAMRVAETWKPGRKGIDDGVLLLIAKNDRALRIEVGYGLEGAITDAAAKRIIAEIITPLFKQGHFGTGIQAGLEAVMRLIQGEALPPPQAKPSANTPSDLDNFLSILIFSLLLGRVLQVFLGRLAGSGVTGVGLGFVGWLISSSVMMAIIIAIVAFVLNLFLHANPGIYRAGRGWSGHDRYRGGFGGGGFGGGGFGGGGASGRW